MLNAMLRRFIVDEQGAEMVEWAVVTVVLLGFTTVALILIKDELIKVFEAAFAALQKDPPDTYMP
jgi:Flp pilus assembly pilin Flp